MASPNPPPARFGSLALRLAFFGSVALFLWVCGRFYLPGQGFTYLVEFGGRETARYLPELRALNFHAQPDSYGYDAQYYAQIAMRPQLGDPELREAVDSLPYRARRILFCWTAYVLGGGNPEAALLVFSVQNIVAWLLLAWVLLRWFPPTGWENFLRWFAVMFTFGLCFSVRNALVDGPSLLLIAIGMALFERGRTGWSAVVLGIAGLGKETNILAGSIFAPARWRDGREWRRAIGHGLLIAAPLALWLVCLQLWLGSGGDLGARNFDWPFAGYVRKWQEIAAGLSGSGSGELARAGALVLIALTVQWLFFVLRPRWSDPWWRLGASYCLLLVVLGDAVWEGYPGAASRVLLPMTLAFNVLLPRGRGWWVLLVVGNLLVWPSADKMVPPGREDSRVLGAHELRVERETGEQVQIQFPDPEWYGLERSYFSYWRWSKGDAGILLRNPHAGALRARLSFELKSSDERQVTVRIGDRVLWSGETGEKFRVITAEDVVLWPGDNLLRFETDRPAASPPNGDPRVVAFRVCDFELTLVGRE